MTTCVRTVENDILQAPTDKHTIIGIDTNKKGRNSVDMWTVENDMWQKENLVDQLLADIPSVIIYDANDEDDSGDEFDDDDIEE